MNTNNKLLVELNKTMPYSKGYEERTFFQSMRKQLI